MQFATYLLDTQMNWIAKKFRHLLLRNDQSVGFCAWNASRPAERREEGGLRPPFEVETRWQLGSARPPSQVGNGSLARGGFAPVKWG